MQDVSRDQLKKLFKKSKKLRIPEEFSTVNFKNIFYYSWLDQSDMTLFVVYEFKQTIVGIKFDVVLPPTGALRLGFCEFCHKHRKQADVFFISTETKKRPKGVNYRSCGTWVCSKYELCNASLKNTIRIEELFTRILE